MFKSEYLLNRELLCRKIPHEWLFAKPGKKYGCDLKINDYKVEVKEVNPSRQKIYYKNKTKQLPETRYSCRVNFHKHGMREDVDFYIILIRDEFYIVPAFVFASRMGINANLNKITTLLFCYKSNYKLLDLSIELLKEQYPAI